MCTAQFPVLMSICVLRYEEASAVRRAIATANPAVNPFREEIMRPPDTMKNSCDHD